MQIAITKGAIRLRADSANFDGDNHTCKCIPSGIFNRKEKCWEYPYSAALEIAEKVEAKHISSMSDGFMKLLDEERVKYQTFLAIMKQDFIGEHEFLYGHQYKCVKISEIYDRFAYFMDTGTGKTLTGLSIVSGDTEKYKWAIIPPKTTIKHSWLEDSFDFFPQLRVFPLSQNYQSGKAMRTILERWGVPVPHKATVKQIQKLGIDAAHAYIVNTESLATCRPIMKEQNVKALIVDESVKLKNPNAAITKEVSKWSPELFRLYLLSGKPAPNGEFDYFSQMRLVDPSLFGVYITKFKDLFFRPVGQFDIEIRPDMKDVFSERLARKAFFISKKDCLDLPEETFSIRSVELPKEARDQYKKLQKDLLIMVNDKKITAVNAGVLGGKLRQLTSGFLYPEAHTVEDQKHRVAVRLHEAKLTALDEMLEQFKSQPVVVWIAFQEDVAIITEHLEKKKITYATAYARTRNVDEEISRFLSGEAMVLVGHPKSVKYGLSFVGRKMWQNCTEDIFYSYTESYDDFYQAKDRINRNGQDSVPTHHFIIVEDSVDTVTYKKLRHKGDNATFMEELVKQAQEAFE